MKLAKALALLTAVISLVTSSRNAVADDVFRPDGVRIVQADWTFVPVVQITETNSVDVVGVLALRDSSQVYGDNLVAVWYENPHADETWPAISWKSQSQWDAITWVKDTYGITEECDFMWPTSEENPNEPALVEPEGYEGGLIEGDPFAELLGQYTHAEVVAILVEAGYAAASIPVDVAGPCDSKSLLPALVDVTVAHVLFDITEAEAQNALVTMVSSSCAQLTIAAWNPFPPPGTTAPGIYVPRPALPGYPASDPRSVPGHPSVPRCRTTVSPAACICTWTEVWYNCPGCPPAPGGAPGAIRRRVTLNCPASVCTGPVPNAPGAVPGAAGCTPDDRLVVVRKP
ncbi:MAG TPA: hypothetical protein VD997_06585 [Phycisphaerales bacterium]|nr:hypothetical protein [Phycisphaerales bacterium]